MTTATKTKNETESRDAKKALITLLQNRRQKFEQARLDLTKISAAVEAQQAKWARKAIDDLPEAAAEKMKLDGLLEQRQDAELRVAGLAQGLEETLKDKATRDLATEAEKAAGNEIAEIELECQEAIKELNSLQKKVVTAGIKLMSLQQDQQDIYNATAQALKLVHGRKYRPEGIRSHEGYRLAGVPFRNDILTAWRECNQRETRTARTPEISQELFSSVQ